MWGACNIKALDGMGWDTRSRTTLSAKFKFSLDAGGDITFVGGTDYISPSH